MRSPSSLYYSATLLTCYVAPARVDLNVLERSSAFRQNKLFRCPLPTFCDAAVSVELPCNAKLRSTLVYQTFSHFFYSCISASAGPDKLLNIYCSAWSAMACTDRFTSMKREYTRATSSTATRPAFRLAAARLAAVMSWMA